MKRLKRDYAPKKTSRDRHLRGELLFLEFLRGFRGVPQLYGGWFEGPELVYIVQYAGLTLGLGTEGSGAETQVDLPNQLGVEYAAYARSSPLDAATALLRCFESFSQRSGYFMHSVKAKQFAIALPPPSGAAAEIFLIDGPDVLHDPIASFLKEHGWWGMVSHTTQPSKSTCRAHADCKSRYERHTSAREARGFCGRRGICEPLSSKTHVFDVATQPWALPWLLQAAKDAGDRDSVATLAKLIDEMRSERPADRPTFSQALASLTVTSS